MAILEDIVKERKDLERITSITQRASHGLGLDVLNELMDFAKIDRTNQGEVRTFEQYNDRQLEAKIREYEGQEKGRVYQKVQETGYSNVLAQITDSSSLLQLALSAEARATGNEDHDRLVKKIGKFKETRQKISQGDLSPYFASLEKRPRVLKAMQEAGDENKKLAAKYFLESQQKELIKEFVEGEELSADKLRSYILANEGQYKEDSNEKVELYASTALALPKPGNKKKG
jgi:hypothetical protein